LVERLVWDQEVAGSNPVTPTTFKMSITTVLALLIGLIMGVAFTIAYSAYHYYKAWKQAHDEGWDLPS
jgi:hypothetical protein